MKEYFGFLLKERKRERVRKTDKQKRSSLLMKERERKQREIVEYKEKRLQTWGR